MKSIWKEMLKDFMTGGLWGAGTYLLVLALIFAGKS